MVVTRPYWISPRDDSLEVTIYELTPVKNMSVRKGTVTKHNISPSILDVSCKRVPLQTRCRVV